MGAIFLILIAMKTGLKIESFSRSPRWSEWQHRIKGHTGRTLKMVVRSGPTTYELSGPNLSSGLRAEAQDLGNPAHPRSLVALPKGGRRIIVPTDGFLDGVGV